MIERTDAVRGYEQSGASREVKAIAHFAMEGTGERKLGAFEGSGQSSLEAGTVEHGAALAVVFPAHYRLCGLLACA